MADGHDAALGGEEVGDGLINFGELVGIDNGEQVDIGMVVGMAAADGAAQLGFFKEAFVAQHFKTALQEVGLRQVFLLGGLQVAFQLHIRRAVGLVGGLGRIPSVFQFHAAPVS
jgi:hypothetical protein